MTKQTKEQALETIRSEWDSNWYDKKELEQLEASNALKTLQEKQP